MSNEILRADPIPIRKLASVPREPIELNIEKEIFAWFVIYELKFPVRFFIAFKITFSTEKTENAPSSYFSGDENALRVEKTERSFSFIGENECYIVIIKAKQSKTKQMQDPNKS